MTRPSGLICTRLEDMTVMHSDQIESACSRCGKLVGIYPTGQAMLKHYPDMTITCSVCTNPWRQEKIMSGGSC
jgi:hypothetical protein